MKHFPIAWVNNLLEALNNVNMRAAWTLSTQTLSAQIQISRIEDSKHNWCEHNPPKHNNPPIHKFAIIDYNEEEQELSWCQAQ